MSEAKIVFAGEDRTAPAVRSVKQGLESVASVAARAGFNLAAIGGSVTVAGLTAMIKSINDGVDALNDIKDATGSSIENISALEDIAMRNGHAFEAVGQSLMKFNQVLSSTNKPGSEAERILGALGLKARELRQLDPSEALRRTAVAMSEFAEEGEKARAAQELFGKSLKEVAPFLGDLAQAGELQAKVTAQQAEEAEKFNKLLFGMQANMKDAGRVIAAEVIPTMSTLVASLTSAETAGGSLAKLAGGGLKVGLETIGVLANEAAFMFQGLGRTIGGVAAMAGAFFSGNFEGMHVIRQAMNADDARADRARQTTNAKIMGTATAFEEGFVGPSGGAKKLKVPGGGSDKESEYDKLNKKVMERLQLGAQELRFGRELTDMEKFEQGVLEDMRTSKEKLTAAQQAHIVQLLENAKAQDYMVQRQRIQQKDALDMIKVWDEEAKAQREFFADMEKLDRERRRDVQQTLSDIEFETRLIGMNNSEREVAVALRQLELKGIKEGTVDWQEYSQQIRAAVENRTKVQQQAEALNGMWTSMEGAAHDMWNNFERDGIRSLKRVGQTIKSAIWDLLYQLTVKRWIIGIGTSMGIPAAVQAAETASAASGALGGLGSLGSLGSLGGMAGSAGLFGSGFMSGLSAWGSGGSVTGLLGSVNMAGGFANAAGTVLGALGPVIAGVAALVAVMKATKGETRQGADLGYWHDLGASETFRQSGGNPMGATAAKMLTSTALGLNTLFAGLGVGATTAELHGGFASSDKGRGGVYAGGNLSIGGRIIQFGEVGGRGVDTYESTSARSLSAEEAAKNFGADLLQVQIQALQAASTEIPESIRKMVEGINAEALSDSEAQQLLTSIGQVVDQVKAFRQAVSGLPFEWLADVSFDAATRMAEAAGGFDALTAGIGAFAELTLTSEEKRLVIARQIADAINAAGGQTSAEQVLGTSAAAFKGWVQQISGDNGLYGAAMKVAPAMQQLTTSMEDAARAAAEAAEEEARLQQERAQARAAALEGYFANYLTPDEQRLRTAQSIQQRLAAAGGEVSLQTILTATLQDFRKVFQQAWDSGNGQMVDALLDVQEQFHGLASAAETLGDAFERGRSSLDAYVGVFDRQIGGLQTGLTRDRGYLDQLRGFKSELGLGPLAGLTGEQQYLAQRAEFQRLMALPTNSEERLKALPGAGRAFLEASSAHLGGGSMQHILNRAMVMGTTEASELSMQSAVEIAQAQLTVLEEQRDALQAIRDLQEAGNQAQLDAAIAYINTAGAAAGLSTTAITAAIQAAQVAQGVLDAGHTGAITAALATNALTVGSAVTTLGGQISAQLAAMTAVAQGDPNSPWSVGNTGTGVPGGTPLAAGWILHPMFGAIDAGGILRGFHTRSDVHGAESWLKSMGLTQADAASLTQTPLDAVRQWFASGGVAAFAQGANLIPQDMLAVVHRHEAIIPAAFNPWAPAGGGAMAVGGWRAGGDARVDTSRLEQKIGRLEAQLEHLIKVVAGSAQHASQQREDMASALRARDLTQRFAPHRKAVAT